MPVIMEWTGCAVLWPVCCRPVSAAGSGYLHDLPPSVLRACARLGAVLREKKLCASGPESRSAHDFESRNFRVRLWEMKPRFNFESYSHLPLEVHQVEFDVEPRSCRMNQNRPRPTCMIRHDKRSVKRQRQISDGSVSD
ncbi:hypothetical protein BDV18DRAFT_128835 [Aspergillus unguis]